MKTILFLDTVHPSLADRLTADGHECIHCEQMECKEIDALLPKAYGIVIRSRFTMDEYFLNSASELKFIARSGVGMENIDEFYCKENGIAAFNAAGGNAEAVAEHVIGMLLTMYNKLHTADREVKSSIWRREANRGIELGSRTVGIIGFGHCGSALAKKLSGFGCRILAYDKYRAVSMNGVEEVDLNTIYKDCDVISFHVPLTEETHHYFDSTFLDSMGQPFYLVNASRGKVASTQAINQGLKSKKILGACLDVLEQEGADFNLGDSLDVELHKLLSSDRLLISPHVAGWTVESYEKLADVLYEQIQLIVD